MSKPILYVHIGTHKTGSTAIQNMLRQHQHVLSRRGLFAICPHLGFESLMHADSLPPKLARDFSKCIRAQMRTYRKQPACRYVTSWEGYCGNPMNGYRNVQVLANALKSSLHGVDVKIIIYLRRQDDFLESLYTQMIHEGESYSFREFSDSLGKDVFDWNRLLDAYGKAFGRKSLVVRRYGREFLPKSQSLLRDFFTICGTDINGLPSPEGTPVNRGYSRAALEIARLCNPELSKYERRILRGILQETGARKTGEKYRFMSSFDRLECFEQYRSANQKIASEFFQREPMLFVCPDTEESSGIGQTYEFADLLPAIVRNLMTRGRTAKGNPELLSNSAVNAVISFILQKYPGPFFRLRNQLLKVGLI